MTFTQALEAWPALLEKVLPKKTPRKALLKNIMTLAEGFTLEKESRVRGYLGHPALLEAYFWWYLPWNLYKLRHVLERMTDFFPTQITDLGAGPATFTLAASLLRPEWLQHPIGWSLVEPEGQALDWGLKLLSLVTQAPASSWRFTRIKERLGAKIQRSADLVVASHVWNETQHPVQEFYQVLTKGIQPQTTCLVVEPGDRQGSRRVTALRRLVAEKGLHIQAPCTHGQGCPATGEKPGSRFCHFGTVETIPVWLKNLSDELGFPKERNPVAYVAWDTARPHYDVASARVISGPVPIDNSPSILYACGAEGLLVAEQDNQLFWGSEFRYRSQGDRDPKTQGWKVSKKNF